jgi:hypothetical protein
LRVNQLITIEAIVLTVTIASSVTSFSTTFNTSTAVPTVEGAAGTSATFKTSVTHAAADAAA